MVKIGLLDIMPDKALKATDRQFRAMLGANGAERQASLLIFTLPEIVRGDEAARYIADTYVGWDEIRTTGLDALVISGTNVPDPRLDRQPFWEPLIEVMDWARDNVRTTLCSCLASHAVMQFRYGQLRRPQPAKVWGVFAHRVLAPEHPLVHGLPATVMVPQSRHNAVEPEQFAAAGLEILIASDTHGVHLAADAGSRLVLMQGHPEYDPVSLLKEYKRDVALFAAGRLQEFPPLPISMLDAAGQALARRHARDLHEARDAGRDIPPFPEDDLAVHLPAPWLDPARRVFTNWVERVAAR